MVPKDRSDYIFRMFRLLFLDMSDGKYATTIREKMDSEEGRRGDVKLINILPQGRNPNGLQLGRAGELQEAGARLSQEDGRTTV